MEQFEAWKLGALGQYGTIGLYGIALRVFLVFGLLAAPALCVIGKLFSFQVYEGKSQTRHRADAPFGRFIPSSFAVNGTVGWLLMELVSPLVFVAALSTPLSAQPISLRLPSLVALELLPATFFNIFTSLPPARSLLAFLFVLHYFNRSLVQSWRNPGRSEMSLIVPLAAAIFNSLNGSLLGFFIAGGAHGTRQSGPLTWAAESWGVQPGREWLFGMGCILWLAGLISNIICDEILYSLRRNQPPKSPNAPPRERYGIPRGFLYDWPFGGVSHPSYLCEWVEWSGFLLATLALAPSAFPIKAVEAAGSGSRWINVFSRSSVLRKVPRALWPMTSWALQPPALFLWNSIGVMLPRAVSGHRWYKRTFGILWPKERKAIFPGLL